MILDFSLNTIFLAVFISDFKYNKQTWRMMEIMAKCQNAYGELSIYDISDIVQKIYPTNKYVFGIDPKWSVVGKIIRQAASLNAFAARWQINYVQAVIIVK
jgi:hypothetical protein